MTERGGVLGKLQEMEKRATGKVSAPVDLSAPAPTDVYTSCSARCRCPDNSLTTSLHTPDKALTAALRASSRESPEASSAGSLEVY